MKLRKTDVNQLKVGPSTSQRGVGTPNGETSAPEIQSPDRVSLSTKPLEPQGGVVYEVHRASQRPVALSFDDKAVAFFHNAGLKFDLEQAQIVTEDGRRVPLDHRAPLAASPRDQYEVSAGYKLPSTAEPWQFRVPGIPSQVFGKPYGVLVEGAEQGLSLKFLDVEGKIVEGNAPTSETDDFQGMRVDTKVFRRNRSSTLGKLARHQPIATQTGPARLPFVGRSPGEVLFRAPTESALVTAKTAFDSLLGSVARDREVEVDLPKLEIYESQVQKVIQKKLELGEDVDGYAAMLEGMDHPEALNALHDFYGMQAGQLSRSQLFQGVSQKVLRASPIEIVVIPKDKTALDCVENPSESAQAQLRNAGRAYFLRTDPMSYRAQTGAKDLPVQRLFVGEEILESEKGVKAVLMHEMLHVFEHVLATPQQIQQIESSFQQASEFQSLYGSNRDEYLTTVGEEFLGTHGAEGPEWVKAEHRPVFDLLSKLTDSPTG